MPSILLLKSPKNREWRSPFSVRIISQTNHYLFLDSLEEVSGDGATASHTPEDVNPWHYAS
jgi:hypothetical protein